MLEYQQSTKLLFRLAEDENTIQIREGDTKNTTTTLPIAVSTCRSTSVSKALKTHLPKQGYRWCEGSFGPIQTEAAACSLQVRGDQPLLIFAGGEAGDFSARQLFSSTNICAAVYSLHYYSHDTNTAFTSTGKNKSSCPRGHNPCKWPHRMSKPSQGAYLCLSTYRKVIKIKMLKPSYYFSNWNFISLHKSTKGNSVQDTIHRILHLHLKRGKSVCSAYSVL